MTERRDQIIYSVLDDNAEYHDEAPAREPVELRQPLGLVSDYDESLKDVLESEGGYSNDRGDPGGPTKYGITIFDARMFWKKNVTAADMRAMPLSVAKDIYRTKYWQRLRCDELPPGVDYSVFDYGVNSGIGRAASVLRSVLHCAPGTTIDDSVVAAARKAVPQPVINSINDERMRFLRGLRTWRLFGRGWSTRVANVRRDSLTMARTHIPQDPADFTTEVA